MKQNGRLTPKTTSLPLDKLFLNKGVKTIEECCEQILMQILELDRTF